MHLTLVAALITTSAGYFIKNGTSEKPNCYLFPQLLNSNVREFDDAPSIQQAFKNCGQGGNVIFTNHTFNINSVMNTTHLANCNIILKGELRFSTDIEYWLENSIDAGFPNQTTAWLLGGENVTFKGDGGWYNGQGQTWYTENENHSNQPGRPISLTFYESKNLLVDGLSIIQPQFWATFVAFSTNVSITNLYVNATSNDQWSTVNTDGYDSFNSDNLLVENAVIQNGDDCIAAKGNTTNLHVRNITCYNNFGMTIGSVGQYPATPDYVENVTFEDVTCHNCNEGAFIKTWQGETEDGSSNGNAGGGGSGYVRNVTFRNFEMNNVSIPIQISQCIYTEADGKYCNTSKIAISDITWSGIKASTKYNVGASIYCSDLHPCPGIKFEEVELRSVNSSLGLPMYNTTLQREVYQCKNIIDQGGTGIPCNLVAPSDYSQIVTSNIQG